MGQTIFYKIIDGFVDKYLLTYFFFQWMTKAAFSHSAEAEAWIHRNIWPKAEYQSRSQILIFFFKLLSICCISSFNLNFANPFLKIIFLIHIILRNLILLSIQLWINKVIMENFTYVCISIWFHQKWTSIPWVNILSS